MLSSGFQRLRPGNLIGLDLLACSSLAAKGGCESESLGFSASLTGIGLCLPFNSKYEDIPTYVKYPLEVTSEFWTLSEREDDNAVGRNMDADRGNQFGKLFYSFIHVGYGCLGTS